MNISQVNYQDPKAKQDFAQSLKETGFAVIRSHPISETLLNAVYQDWQEFFESPSKFDLVFDPKLQSGYFPFKSENAKDSAIKDLKEFFQIYPATRMPQTISYATFQLRSQLIEMASQLLNWLQQETPSEIKNQFSVPLPEMIQASEATLFRILHYPPLPKEVEPGAVRAAAHEDINLITLLPAATAPGLEVKDSQGRWIAVPCDPGNIIVNAGDMLQVATHAYYRSTTHRVVNPIGDEAQKSRYSMPLFLHPRSEVQLSTSLTAGDYLNQRLREIGLKK